MYDEAQNETSTISKDTNHNINIRIFRPNERKCQLSEQSPTTITISQRYCQILHHDADVEDILSVLGDQIMQTLLDIH